MKSILSTVVLLLLAVGFVADGLRQQSRPIPLVEAVPTTVDERPELARMIRIPALYKQTLQARQERWLRQIAIETRVAVAHDALLWESLHPVEPSRNAPRLEPDDY